MRNLVQDQIDLTQLLLSSDQLKSINIVMERPAETKFEILVANALTDPRNGNAGAALIVKRPTATFHEPSVSGPIMNWKFTVLSLVIPQLNTASGTIHRPATGTFMTAEDLMQIVLDEVHHYADEGSATFVPMADAVVPANIYEQDGKGYAQGHEINFMLKNARTIQTPRTGQVQVTQGMGTISFACALDPAADIFYTLDGSFPGNKNAGSSSSVKFDGNPLNVVNGQVIRARAYASGKLGSATTYTKIP